MNIEHAKHLIEIATKGEAEISLHARNSLFSNFTEERAQEIVDALVFDGAEYVAVRHTSGTTHVHHLKSSDGFEIKIWFTKEKSREEECAELKARLAELGCHYG